MESTKSPTGSMRRHRPRRSTRGPLDAVDDPLAGPPKSPSVESTHSPEHGPIEPSVTTEDVSSSVPIDLSFLQDRANYHQIPTDDIPPVFLNSNNQPPVGTPLPDLVKHGHFRRAAATALDELLQSPSNEAERILQLLYIRLACLVLISKPDIAAHESAILTDFLARGSAPATASSAVGAEDLLPIIPWELRLLLVRLQTISAADGGRRGMMSLYALAQEVRQRLRAAKETDRDEEVKLWSERLSDLGLRVVDTLVEMGELETATRHLDTLVEVPGDELAYRKALLRLRVGDASGARRCIADVQDPNRRSCLEALVEVGDGHFTKSTELWRNLSNQTNQALLTSNLAVGLVYTGRVAETRGILEDLARESPAFYGILFNLGTVYELCTEEAMQRKMRLTQNMAEKMPVADTGGWEREREEFKL